MIYILSLKIPKLSAVLIIPLSHLVIHIIHFIHQRMSIIRTGRIRILEVHSHQVNPFPKIFLRFQLSRDKIAHVSPSPVLNFLNMQLSKEHHEIHPVHLLISLKLLQQFCHAHLILFINEPIDGLSHLREHSVAVRPIDVRDDPHLVIEPPEILHCVHNS